MSLFDGDPAKWEEFILRDGTADERANDAPFIDEVRRRAEADPEYLERLRAAMSALATLLPPGEGAA